MLILILFFNCSQPPKETEPITLIPKVKSLTVNDGVYVLNQNITIDSPEQFEGVINYFEAYLKPSKFSISKTR